jgi:hypothetical protein
MQNVSQGTTARPRMQSVSAVIIRCGCGAPLTHLSVRCPKPLRIEDLGTVAYWHRNPLRRLWYRLTKRTSLWN